MPDEQTSKDLIYRVALGTLGTGLNPLLEREASNTRARRALHSSDSEAKPYKGEQPL
ncbi:conserved hypothetical protein [Ricinus communis]|uniref:Uncharacterized protein n=1 Tax=Ricinus communis TaxID=3988 RepID=B9T622_RICCO|nr:conserved hypothetical protein [Ricinus communis]